VNVLFLTFTYPTPDTPTAGVFVQEHARAAATHANVAVVHLMRGGGRYRIENVADAEFPTLRVRYPRTKAAYPLHFVGAIHALWKLRRRGFVPDVIHAHVFLAALPPLLLRPFFEAPVVVTEHWSVFLPEDPASLSAPMLQVARIALRRAAFVLPVSLALQRGMEVSGIRARYRVISNVADTELFHTGGERRSGSDRRLLYVGLLYPAKGIETMLRAFELARRTRSDIVLDVVGDGPDREAYERLAAQLGLQDVVRFSGRLPKQDVAERMRNADLFLLTSRYDNNPCALIEAQASGLPAVATRVGGIPEILEDGGGLLADPGDVESIAARILEALDRPDAFDRDAIARHARERYGADVIGAQFQSVYRDAVERR
jgi:glycosyltransferase involved in cell wall biosynthesis